MSEQEEQKLPNIYISGDEARLLMQLLMVTPALQLYSNLNVINTVQPSTQPTDIEPNE